MGFKTEFDPNKNISKICILDGEEKQLYEVAADLEINGERVLLLIMEKDFEYDYVTAAKYNAAKETIEFFSEEDTEEIVKIVQQDYNIMA